MAGGAVPLCRLDLPPFDLATSFISVGNWVSPFYSFWVFKSFFLNILSPSLSPNLCLSVSLLGSFAIVAPLFFSFLFLFPLIFLFHSILVHSSQFTPICLVPKSLFLSLYLSLFILSPLLQSSVRLPLFLCLTIFLFCFTICLSLFLHLALFPSPSLPHLPRLPTSAMLSPAPARPGPTHRRRRPRRGAGRARPARRAAAAWCRLPAAALPGIVPARPGGNAHSPSQNSWAAPGFLAQANRPLQRPLRTPWPRGAGRPRGRVSDVPAWAPAREGAALEFPGAGAHRRGRRESGSGRVSEWAPGDRSQGSAIYRPILLAG